MSTNHPNNQWARFVRQTVGRYRGRVGQWEVWNEPDLREIFWAGSVADYYQLLKTTYMSVKFADPSAKVLIGGIAHWPDPGFLDELFRLMRLDPTASVNNHYFDILALHSYSVPRELLTLVAESRRRMSAMIGPRPIWINETNISAWDESTLNDFSPFEWSATVHEQASYILQALALAAASGVEVVMVYRLHDVGEDTAAGLARSDRTTRPAYLAYQLATRYLSHATSSTLARQGTVQQVIVRRPGERVSFVWNQAPTGVTASVGAFATSAVLIEQDGTMQRIRAAAGQYRLELAAATANRGQQWSDYIIGGPPRILVETLPESLRTVEETSSHVEYAGTGRSLSMPGASGGAVRRMGAAGAFSVSLGFSGPTVTWLTSKGPDRGIARVEVDGVFLGEIDLYSSEAVWHVPLTFGDFGPGVHRLTITGSGQRSYASAGSYVDIDGFVAETISPLRSAHP